MKKFIIVLSLTLIFTFIFAASVCAADKVLIKHIGDEGEASWKLYDSGRLYIYGEGVIPNYKQAESDFSDFDTEITKIEIEDGITAIGKYAFYALPNLKEVIIPDSVDTIGIGAFSKCAKLTEISIGGDVEAIPSECFSGCSLLDTVELPDTLKNIRTEAFKNCKSLTEITIPADVESIGYQAFYGCTKLEEVTFLGDSPETLGDKAFTADEDLTIYVGKKADGFDDKFWKNFNIETDKGIKDDKDEDDTEAGDINGDGKVNLVDRRILTYCLAGYKDYPYEEYEEIGDADGDGSFTVLDVIILARYIDGWDDYELEGYGW